MTETTDRRKHPKSKTVAAVVGGVIIAIAPALFTYLENRDQIKSKTQKNQEDATAGYAALAVSVKELQTEVLAQHDYIIKLETNLAAMDKYVLEALNRAVAARPVVGGRPQPVTVVAEKPVALRPPVDPKFRDLPHDLPDAAKQYGPP